MPFKQKKNKYSCSTSVPQNSQIGNTNQPNIHPNIAFGKLATLGKNWDISWSNFRGSQEQLKAQQIRVCTDIVQKCLDKGVKFPPLETSNLSLDEARLIWHSCKLAELMGLGGAL